MNFSDSQQSHCIYPAYRSSLFCIDDTTSSQLSSFLLLWQTIRIHTALSRCAIAAEKRWSNRSVRAKLSKERPKKGARGGKGERERKNGETKIEATDRRAQHPRMYNHRSPMAAAAAVRYTVGTYELGKKHTSRFPLFGSDALENAMFLAPPSFPARPFAWQTT